MLSKIAQNITPSATCELEGVVADMKAAGVDIIGMNAGEPDFDTPENIRDACKWALDEGKTRYVNVPGIADLRKAICEKLKKDKKRGQIVMIVGAVLIVVSFIML